jgi:3-hydroxyisobutyrate dehydrogenase-like beta-hydroxyacid dehydrogenase
MGAPPLGEPALYLLPTMRQNANMRIGFIGLGQMGRGMASRLLDAGHQLTVWNRSPAAAVQLAARGAERADRLDQTLASEIVISMLADDAAVRAVWIDSGLIQRTSPATTHLNMASVSLRLGRELTELHGSTGAAYVAAPVFGRPEFAAKGQLDIVAAGPAAALARCAPLFEILGRRSFIVGDEAYQANLVKIARNFVLATIIEGLGESFALVGGAGVSCEKFLEIITSTSMSAPAYKDYGRRILHPPEQPTFALHLGLKDVELVLAAARDSGLRLACAELLHEHHLSAIADGYGDNDWAELGNWIIAHARQHKT